MALYDNLFGLMDLQAAQVLVTSNDFLEPTFRENLAATAEDLLNMSVVPVFNENDAISARDKVESLCKTVSFFPHKHPQNSALGGTSIPGPLSHFRSVATNLHHMEDKILRQESSKSGVYRSNYTTADSHLQY